MLYPKQLTFNTSKQTCTIVNKNFKTIKSYPISDLMPSINRKDINNKTMYLNDIFEIKGNKLYKGIFKWDDSILRFIVDWEKDGIKHYLPEYVNIIGNTFENPDLLNNNFQTLS